MNDQESMDTNLMLIDGFHFKQNFFTSEGDEGCNIKVDVRGAGTVEHYHHRAQKTVLNTKRQYFTVLKTRYGKYGIHLSKLSHEQEVQLIFSKRIILYHLC